MPELQNPELAAPDEPLPVREAPSPSPIYKGVPTPGDDPSLPEVDEPVLETDDIQGNILPGFNKDFQTLIFLKLTEPASCKAWVRRVTPFIATATEVVAFNRLFKACRRRRGESRAVQSTWVNIAFSFNGLKQLATDADTITDGPFREGMLARSAGLGDPTDPAAEGHPRNWVVGGPGREADILLIVASDDHNDMAVEVERMEEMIFGVRDRMGNAVRSGLELVYKQTGAVLPPPLTGHEHFGFLDGVSQPGIRGRLSAAKDDLLTPRQNPNDRDQGKPGQDLLWPGEFVLGYPEQRTDIEDDITKPSDQPSSAGPAWTRNGSFLVFRRLRQDVEGFHRFLNENGTKNGLDPRHLGAKVVGRWATGAPIMRTPDADDPLLGDTDCANNNFEFREDADPLPANPPGSLDCTDERPKGFGTGAFPPTKADPDGLVCPFSAHIRKTYPRDDESKTIIDPSTGKSLVNEVTTQTHRLLRRGIPFGPPSRSTPDVPQGDFEDRGLLFLCYQTSLEDQFEFVQTAWANDPEFVHGDDPSKDSRASGFDLIIGQNGGGPREAVIDVKVNGQVCPVTLRADRQWVIPTGGGYFFAPSISALEKTLG